MDCVYRVGCALTEIEGCTVEAFGIEVLDSRRNMILSVPAIFSEKIAAEVLVNSLNRNHLDPNQLYELLDDLL